MQDLANVRIVAVHAHPDDESISTGLLLAHAARRGAQVTVVTCTLGEEGEVIGDYQRLVAAETGLLGGYRLGELERALAALGTENSQPRLLGGIGTWRDSGMAGSESAQNPVAFSNPDAPENFPQQVSQLQEILRELQPDILVTYAPDGGYGHPDHIRAHEITHAAVEDGAVPSVQQILWARTVTQDVEAGLRGVEAPAPWTHPEEGEIASVDASEVDFHIHGSVADVEAKQRAMAAHVTQIWMADCQSETARPEIAELPEGQDQPMWALSNLVAQPLLDTEAYAVGYSAPGVAQNYAEQLFAGEASDAS